MSLLTLRNGICRVSALLLFGALATPSLAIEPRHYHAEQINAASISELPRGGMDAIAGTGDWWLSDGELCAAVSDVEHDAGIVAGGGSLIDIGFCARRDDQWTYANVLTGLAKEKAIRAQHISANSDRGSAEITVVGEDEGLRQTLRYVLSRDHPGELALWVEVERIAKGRAVQLSGMLTLYPNRAMTPYALSSYLPQYSLGFNHQKIDRNNVFSLVKGMMPADWNILLGSHVAKPSISYGVQLQSAYLTDNHGVDRRLPQFLLTLPHYSLHGWMTRPLWFDSEKLGLLQMAQSQLMDLDVGESMRAHFRILPGARADVAAISDRIYVGPRLTGSVNVAPVVVEVHTAEGLPLSQRRVDQPGDFSLRLPATAGELRLTARSPWGETLSKSFSAVQGEVGDAGALDVGALVFKQRSGIRLPRGNAMKLIFYGINGTATPRLRDDLLDFRSAGEAVEHSLVSNNVSLAGIDSDPQRLYLPAGSYRVLATRGIEFSVTTAELVVRPGVMQNLKIELPRRELSSEWVSADLHVHASASFDSALPLSEQIRAFVAQDANVLVLAEHNRIVDGSAVLDAMGLGEQLSIITGAELTGMSRTTEAPTTIGHSNIFPLAYRESLYAGGIPRTEATRLRGLIAQTRYRYPQAIFQLNHPRSADPLDADSAFFDHLSLGKSFEPSLPLTHSRNRSLLESDPRSSFRDIDFDVMEVLNGADMETYAASRRDWFALLKQGLPITAAGNSDSHKLDSVAAVPRNYIQLANTRAPISEQDFALAIKQGRMYFTSGPLLEVSLGEAGLGDMAVGPRHTLKVMPRAASWVGLDTMRIYLNGRLWREQTITANELYSDIIQFPRDSVLNVEFSGPVTALYREVLPGFAPIALTNPIYIDADGDGRWQPPGVP
ncbi:MAG: hypothetical protein ACI9OO_000317 [Bacteroidia bacterium]|jgi:hypothetical protein